MASALGAGVQASRVEPRSARRQVSAPVRRDPADHSSRNHRHGEDALSGPKYITIDGNDKDDPSAIPAFMEALDEGCDLALGSRFVAGGRGVNTPRLRHLAIRWIHSPISCSNSTWVSRASEIT